jgi:Uncharacterized protein conserved in bacteria (DUF2325)
VNAAAPSIAWRCCAGSHSALPKTITVASIPPALVIRGEAPPAPGPARRTKIWEFNTNLHCSIVGTCLSTGELRQLLKKLGIAPPGSTDHELHGAAVSLAGRHDKAAKLLNKALDERHRLAIRQFEKANTEDAVRALWADAVRQGEIPGAYWATLTHPAATHAVIRDAFGEVHMLSHLVGAANRADIRRLCQLEADNAELQARLDRQQAALRDVVVTRDACIRDLRQALAQCIAAEQPVPGDDTAVLRQLVADLKRRLAGEARHSAALEERLTAAKAVVADERQGRAKAERECSTLRSELNLIETSVLAGCDDNSPEIAAAPRLGSVTVLYVGGRPNQVPQLRAAAERSGTTFLHHDGGIEHHLNLLAGLASQADIVAFPVDCISHHAAQAAKLLCRQTGKRFMPLRSASVTSLLAALRRTEDVRQADAAD